MSEKTRKIAVLTGDIVGSTALGPEKLERAFDALKGCAEMQAEWMGESLHFTRHRGDGWQVALAEPKYALRSALAFRAALKSLGEDFDSYIGIATGDHMNAIQFDLNTEISDVFANSGRVLEDVKDEGSPLRMMNYLICSTENQSTLFADKIVQDWTPIQSQAMFIALTPTSISFSEIADRLGKSRQTTTKTLKSAGISHILTGLGLVESDESHV